MYSMPILFCLLAIAASKTAQAACKTGDAACWCAAKGSPGTFADTTSGCSKYYECVSSTQAYYRNCPSGTLFNDAIDKCDWPNNVSCKQTSPSTQRLASPPPPRTASRKLPPPPKKRRPPPPRRPPPSSKPTVSPKPSPSPSLSPKPPSNSKYRYVGYYQSWSDPWVATASTSRLANLPAYVNIVALSFMRPDATYTSGSMQFTGTGLEFSSSPEVVKGAISLLKERNPGTKVVVAVGGATYTNFKGMNTAAIAAFIKDFGLDGVDLDYEPSNPNCQASGGKVSCATDDEYIGAVRALNSGLPSSALLTTAAWSIGAYGVGNYINAQPQGQYTGLAVNMLNTVGSMLDMVFIMAYDAGTTYDPKQAFLAYTALYNGDVMLGMEVGKEASGEHVISISEVNSLADFVKSKNGAGMMLWSLQKQNTAGPSAESISQAACTNLGLSQCTCPIISATPCS